MSKNKQMKNLLYIKRVFVTVILIMCFSNSIFAQGDSEKVNFRSPVDFPMFLSGTFAELRSGHFHSGIDIKTYEQEGKKVFAIADGYISRIKISSGGYGKALYVTHANGYTSVFAHLSSYNRTINAFVREQQLKQKSYEVDICVEKDNLFYKKGDIIAYTGNSGHSMGPHLHFEIRETLSQKPVNPLNFGFKVKDNIPPTIYGVKVYSQNHSAFHNETVDVKRVSKGKYHPVKDTINAFGDISFGINTIDMLDDTPNHDGVYSVKLFVDDSLLFAWTAEKFAFNETRYINSFIDYAEYKISKRRFMRTKKDFNNNLDMYSYIHNSGEITLDTNEIKSIRYEIKDVFDNTSICDFVVKGEKAPDSILNKENDSSITLDWKKSHSLDFNGFKIDFKKNSFYHDIDFSFSCDSVDKIGEVFSISKNTMPVQKYFRFSVPQNSIPDSIIYKALWMEWDGEEYSSVKTEVKNRRIIAKTRVFGNYVIMYDTLAPEIEFVTPLKHYSSENSNVVSCVITDSLSGIKSYNGYLNNKWIIMEYDEKNDLLTYHFDEFVKKGKNLLLVEVEDEKGNVFEKKIFFKYK